MSLSLLSAKVYVPFFKTFLIAPVPPDVILCPRIPPLGKRLFLEKMFLKESRS